MANVIGNHVGVAPIGRRLPSVPVNSQTMLRSMNQNMLNIKRNFTQPPENDVTSLQRTLSTKSNNVNDLLTDSANVNNLSVSTVNLFLDILSNYHSDGENRFQDQTLARRIRVAVIHICNEKVNENNTNIPNFLRRPNYKFPMLRQRIHEQLMFQCPSREPRKRDFIHFRMKTGARRLDRPEYIFRLFTMTTLGRTVLISGSIGILMVYLKESGVFSGNDDSPSTTTIMPSTTT